MEGTQSAFIERENLTTLAFRGSGSLESLSGLDALGSAEVLSGADVLIRRGRSGRLSGQLGRFGGELGRLSRDLGGRGRVGGLADLGGLLLVIRHPSVAERVELSLINDEEARLRQKLADRHLLFGRQLLLQVLGVLLQRADDHFRHKVARMQILIALLVEVVASTFDRAVEVVAETSDVSKHIGRVARRGR